MEWRHGHPNERLVQFAYRGRRRNHKHCQPVGRPPRYLRAGTRRERLPGLPHLGADQCGVPGCDWRFNTNTDTNTKRYSNGDADCYSATHSDAEVQPVAKSSSNARSPPLTCRPPAGT
jgi:hypothetical protein